MANDLTVFGNANTMLANPDAIDAALDREEQEVQSGGAFGKFNGKRGTYSFGPKDSARDTSDDEIWVIDPSSFQRGFIFWEGLSNMRGKKMVPFFSPEDLTEWRDGTAAAVGGPKVKCHKMRSWIMRSVDYGDQYEFSSFSDSGVREMSEVIRAFGQQVKSGAPFFPVIKCLRAEFPGKDEHGNKIINWKPTFETVGWLDEEGAAALAEGADIGELLETPAPVEATAPRIAPRPVHTPATAKPAAAPKPAALGGRRRAAKSSQ